MTATVQTYLSAKYLVFFPVQRIYFVLYNHRFILLFYIHLSHFLSLCIYPAISPHLQFNQFGCLRRARLIKIRSAIPGRADLRSDFADAASVILSHGADPRTRAQSTDGRLCQQRRSDADSGRRQFHSDFGGKRRRHCCSTFRLTQSTY